MAMSAEQTADQKRAEDQLRIRAEIRTRAAVVAQVHLDFLKDLSKKLESCKSDIEANWRLQVFILVLAIVAMAGWDTAVLKAFLGLSVVDDNSGLIQTVARTSIAILLLFYFFRFGTLLGRYRNLKNAVTTARKEHLFEYRLAHNRERPVVELEAYLEEYTKTDSQFEFYFGELDLPKCGVLAYIALATGLMHAFGAFLIFDVTRQIPRDFSLGAVGVYFCLTLALYVFHICKTDHSLRLRAVTLMIMAWIVAIIAYCLLCTWAESEAQKNAAPKLLCRSPLTQLC